MKFVYFIGIGGIGMSAIARYYNHQGMDVRGYDRTPSPITKALAAEGIKVHYLDMPGLIPSDVENTLVIYTPAVPDDLKEMVYVREKGYRLVKRSAALGAITAGKTCLAVSGTHGKTTTSTMLAHLLTVSGEGCTAFLGGISKNYGSNLLLSTNDVIVAEADEFDRSFLQLFPDITVVTSMDADHLDIYSNIENLRQAFVQLGRQTKGVIIAHKGLENHFTAEGISAKVLTYGEGGDFQAKNIHSDGKGHLRFDLDLQGCLIEDCTLGIPGAVNIENATAAAAAAFLHGTSPEAIKAALASFSGVARRFDIRANVAGHIYIDDYAHHPREIAATLDSIRHAWNGKKICAVFQPHLYSRTNDFHREFAEALSKADSLIMLPIYPAREEPMPGVNSEMILNLVTLQDKKLVEKSELMSELGGRDCDILVTFGAGDIDRFVPEIEKMTKEKYA